MNSTDINVTRPLDINISNRAQRSRWSVLLLYLVLAPVVGLTFGLFLGFAFFDNNVAVTVFTIIVTGICCVVGYSNIENLFIVRNPTTGMFVTIDQLRTLLGKENVNVYYGPGTHISFPWETRSPENNISLTEATNSFEFELQCSNGVIKGNGSYRMRPDFSLPITFLTGVAAVADEIRDLIIADIVNFFKGKNVVTAISMLGELNDYLMDKYGIGKAPNDVEARFGIQIGDVTISKLLPTEEVQRSISAISEAEAIQRGTEILLGISKATMNRRLKDGTLTQADINLARDRFLSISGNLEGMEIKRQEFDVSLHGLDTDAIQSLVELAKTPAAQAAVVGASKKTKPKKTKTS